MFEIAVLLAVLAAACAYALWRRRTDGRLSPVGPRDGSADGSPGPRVDAGDLGHALGEKATLVQFSTAFCQPCRATRRILDDVASAVPGVEHVEVDAESRLDLTRRLRVLRTPTTFVLDADGRVVRRATGSPRKEDVLAALEETVA
ncbi:MAG: TlpA family protein disulfide reductase [Actinomycetes bacterium]